MITLERTRTFINTYEETGLESQISMKIELSAFEDGLVAMLQPRNFTVLLVIYSFIGGESFKPTIQQIAERSGLSTLTVMKSIKELKEFGLV